MFRKLVSTFGLAFLLLGAASTPVSAWILPSFPSCAAPSGTLIASYASGLHGIPGQNPVEGSDSVYITGDTTVLQCYCPASGSSGIQTNWWAIGGMPQEEITSYTSRGWHYIPSGESWGLQPQPYLAQNLGFSCGGSSNDNGGPWSAPGPGSPPVCNSEMPKAPRLYSIIRHGSSATLSWTAVDMADHYTIYYGTKPNEWVYSVVDTGNVTNYTINALDPGQTYYFSVRGVNNCMPGYPSTDGSVLGITTGEVLGLANTGNSTLLIGSLLLGAATLLLAVKYRPSHRA